MANSLSDIRDKWAEMKVSKIQNSTIDIEDFVPNIYEMIKEDCITEYLDSITESLNKGKDEYNDVAYYCEAPYSENLGYDDKEKAWVLRVNGIEFNEDMLELGSLDGDTYGFNFSDIDDGGGKATIGSKTYNGFEDYIKSMNCVNSGGDDRGGIKVRAAGIDCAEIPHYEAVLVYNKDTELEELTWDEINKLSTSKNNIVQYAPYTINKNKSDDPSKWTIKDRNKTGKVLFYKNKSGGKTTYLEVVKKDASYLFDSSNDYAGSTPMLVVGAGKSWGKDTVIDGYKAQRRMKELLVDKKSSIEDMILVVDGHTTTAVRTAPSYTCYTSLYYFPETVTNMIQSWINHQDGRPLSRLSYSPFGTDKYGRMLGTLYVKMKINGESVWVNVSKYIQAGTDFTEPNPDFSGSPELEGIYNGLSNNAFKIGSYNNAYRFIDDSNIDGNESFEKMIALHEELTGLSWDAEQECTLLLGDSFFLIPPQSIRNVTNLDYTKVPLLRSKGTMIKNQANREQVLEIDVFFYGEYGINGIPYRALTPNGSEVTYYMNGLRALFAQFRICPFLPIHNYYINHVLGIEAVSMVGMSLETVEGFPKLIKATLTLREFNYRVYMPDLPIQYVDSKTGKMKGFEPIFAKCFEWEVYRYYYQRCIMHGEEISQYTYNTYEYGEYYYSYKNVLQHANLQSQSIEFYVPDDKWLSQALQVKKDKDRYGQMVSSVSLNDNETEFINNIAADDPLVDNTTFKNKLKDLLSGSTVSLKNSYNSPDTVVGMNTNDIFQTDSTAQSWAKSKTHVIGVEPNDLYTTFKNRLNVLYKLGWIYDVTLDEGLNDANTAIIWTFNIKLDTSKIDLNNLREYTRDLATKADEGSSSANFFKDGYAQYMVTAQYDEEGKFVGVSAAYDAGLAAIMAAGSGENDPSKLSTTSEVFNYANYTDPKAMKFVPYIKDLDGNSIPIDLDLLHITTQNTFTEMYLKAQDGYAPQFMGGGDVTFELMFTTQDLLVVSLMNQLPSYALQTTKTYRRVMPCFPVKVKNDYLQMLGINECLVDNVNVTTVDGYPGTYQIQMRITSVDRTLRQREAMRKINTDGFTSNIAATNIKDYFSLEKALAQSELYPDLDLPTLSELENLGWSYLKYANEDRVYVDPDFYLIYSFQYSAQMTKEIVKKYLYDKYYVAAENDKEDGTETKTVGQCAPSDSVIRMEDDSGLALSAKLNKIMGLDVCEGSENSVSKYAKELMSQLNVAGEQETLFKNSNYRTDSFDDLMELGATLGCLTAYGIENGWQIKEGWYATLSQPYVNDLVEKLKVSNINKANSTKEDQNSKWVEEVYTRRRNAILAINEILYSPMEFSGGARTADITCVADAFNKVFNTDAGIRLLNILDPMGEYKKGKLTKIATYAGDSSGAGNGYYSHKDDYYQNSIGGGSTYKFEEDTWDEGNLPLFLQGYIYAAGCCRTGQEYSEKSSDWGPKQFIDGDTTKYNIRYKDNKVVKQFNKNDKEIKEIANKKGLSMEDAYWYYVATVGDYFGAWAIGKYSAKNIKKMMRPECQVDYKCKKMYALSSKDKWCEKGFLDPYYNYVGYRSKQGRDYIKAISTNGCDNCVAFIRVMLQKLKQMLMDGYLISEVDIIAGNYDQVKQEWDDYIDQWDSALWANAGDQDHGGDGKKAQEKGLNEAIEKRYGMSKEEMDVLIEEDIPKSYSQIFSARMIYPVMLMAIDCNDKIMKMVSKRNYDELNTMTLGTSVGSGDCTPMNKFLKALTGIKLLGTTMETDSDAITSNAQKIFNTLMQEIAENFSNDPRRYVLHSFYDMLVNDKRGRLLRAFPTFYIVFVDEGRRIGTWKLYDNFYNMSAISNIEVVKSRKIPSDTCTFTMSNLYTSYASTYDNTVYQQYVDVYGIKDYFNSIFSPRAYLNTEEMIRGRKQLTDTTVLSAGVRIHVRMGYGSDGSKLPIVFNGKIAEVNCGEVVEVVAQGDGHELMNPLNAFGELEAKSLEEAQSWVTICRDIRGSLARGGETPKNLVAKLMTAKYGGIVKSAVRKFSNTRFFSENPFGIYHFGDRRFKDIFEDSEIVQNLYEVSDEAILSGITSLVPDKAESASTPTINCSLQDKTMWEIVNLCAHAGDDYYAAVRDFGMRSTLCMMKGNHYYAYAYKKLDDKIYEKRKPFQQYHYFDSYNDIIYNTIEATEANMKTNAIGTWQATDYIWGHEQATVGPIYLDMNIYPEYQKSMTVDTGLIAAGNGGIDIPLITALAERWSTDVDDDKVNKQLARKITTNVLRESVKDMYTGSLCVIGDPSVKPYDRFDIIDTYEDMSGQMEVETVVFSMNSDTGFTTTITPDLIVRAVDCNQETSYQNITGHFVATEGIAVTARLGIAKLIESSATATLTSSIMSSAKISALVESVGGAKAWAKLGKLVATTTTGSVESAGAAAVLLNPITLIETIVAGACIFILAKNIQSALYNWLRNIQALTVYPITKYQRQLIAGMAGHRGSVFGYPYSQSKDSIQGMIMAGYEMITDVPIVGSLTKAFCKGANVDGVFNYWRESLGIAQMSNDTNLSIENLYQEICGYASKEFSSNGAEIQALKFKDRLLSFDTNGKTDKTYLSYQIGGVTSANKEAQETIPPDEIGKLSISDIPTNEKVLALTPIEDDDEIKLAKSGGHPIIKDFVIAHSSSPVNELGIKFEGGDRAIKYIVDGDVYDLPMIQTDALYVLKIIMQETALQGAILTFTSGTRVNDSRSWKSTGFAFVLDCDDKSSLLTAVKNARAKTDSETLGPNKKKIKRHVFSYQNTDNGIAITIYPGKSGE